MPRPKKKPEERRTERIAARYTPPEMVQIEQAAARAGMSAAEYSRSQTLKGRVTVENHRTLDHAAFDQLRRIGVNLNQIARIANQTGHVPARLESALARLEDFLLRELDGGTEQKKPPKAKPDFDAAAKEPEPEPGWTMTEPVTVRYDP